MTYHNSHFPLVLTVLQHVATDRLQRAVAALAEGSLTMMLTRQTEDEIRALVKNGEGKEYGVTLTKAGVFCSCADALYLSASDFRDGGGAKKTQLWPQSSSSEPTAICSGVLQGVSGTVIRDREPLLTTATALHLSRCQDRACGLRREIPPLQPQRYID